jgi:hypothetical protein
LKSSGDKASPCFRPIWIGNLSDRYLPTQTSLRWMYNITFNLKETANENAERIYVAHGSASDGILGI